MNYKKLLIGLFAVSILAACSTPTAQNGVAYSMRDIKLDMDSITVPRGFITLSSDQVIVYRDSINSPIYYKLDNNDINILGSKLRFSLKDIRYYQTDNDFYIYNKQNYTGLYIFAFFGFVIWAMIIYFMFVFIPFGIWYQAFLAGVRLSPVKLIFTRFRNVPVPLVLNTMVFAHKANLDVELQDLETVHLAKVDMEDLVELLIEAENAGFHSNLKQLLKFHLAKVDIRQVIHNLIVAKNAGVVLEMDDLSENFLAGINIKKLVECLVMAREADVLITKKDLVTHTLAGGKIGDVTYAVVAAKNADKKLDPEDQLNLSFEVAKNIDLAGINIREAVRDAIEFKVISVDNIRAVALDGVQLSMQVEVTIRPKINMIIEAAGEKTVIAQVVEGIASEIGSTSSHFKILESPFLIADNVLRKDEVGKGTAYKIISIDISNIQIGHDIHAGLQIERAKADAEKAKAELIKADEKVKKAMAAAFFDGKLSIQQYYNLENIESDTNMRRSFSKPPITDPKNHEEPPHKQL